MNKSILGVLLLFISFFCNGQSIIVEFNDSIRQEVLNTHNLYRWALGLDSLSYDDSLEKEAIEWVLFLAEKNKLVHATHRNNHGENLAKTSFVLSVENAINMWGIERLNYNHFTFFKDNTVGHYTQMVWQETSKVGCGLAKNVEGDYFLVCRYSPHGNIVSEHPFIRFRSIYYLFRKKKYQLTDDNVSRQCFYIIDMKNFTAIDFETANGDRNSICQIGLIVYENGIKIKEIKLLVKPPGNYYWGKFTLIHGIDSLKTLNSPSFDSVWKEVEPYITNQNLVAHNGLRFDFPVLKSTLGYYNIQLPVYNPICKYLISKRGLAHLCMEHDIDLDHHNALSDAKACVTLYLKYLKKSNS